MATRPRRRRLPKTENEKISLENYKFERYREIGDAVIWNEDHDRAAYAEWHDKPVPKPNQQQYFVNRINDLDPYTNFAPDAKTLQEKYTDLVGYFENSPRYVGTRALSSGAFGITGLFEDRGLNTTQDVVIKASLASQRSDKLVKEMIMMRKVKHSAHCVQILNRPENKPRTIPLPDFSIDSSSDDDSSGNDDLPFAQIQARHQVVRRERNRRYFVEKRKKWRRAQTERRRQSLRNRNKGRDIIIMEYVKNGTLESLIHKLVEHKHSIYTRIPNRILWGFWLCLIRACIAMEYPPRKFHPQRRPDDEDKQDKPGNLTKTLARANRMYLECKRLGIELIDKVLGQDGNNQHDNDAEQEPGLKDNLIENIPERDKDKMRTQKMIHGDIDPSNVLIGGLELDDEGITDWLNTGLDLEEKIGGRREFDMTRTYSDRRPREHELMPRLKLADFGQATIVKRQKRNRYYSENRFLGKRGFYPPESWAIEWDNLLGSYDGSEIADAVTAGQYSSKTNVWGIALTMWVLITKHDAPAPPQPQLPWHEAVIDSDMLEKYRDRLDTLLEVLGLEGQPISYCPLLRDPSVHDYDWVNEALRVTIYKCMYHNPADRPSLEELLDEALARTENEDFGETDQQIREWVQRWIFDADPSIPPPPPPGPPPGAPPGGPSAPPGAPPFGRTDAPSTGAPPPPPGKKSGKDAEARTHSASRRGRILGPPINDGTIRTAIIIANFNAVFPHGARTIFNRPSSDLLCGVRALAHSLAAQLGPNPMINGIPRPVNLPTAEDLVAIHSEMRDAGFFAGFHLLDDSEDLTSVHNITVDLLATIMVQWGRRNNILLELVAYVEGAPPAPVESDIQNPMRRIWIYNDNAQSTSPEAGNHYSGMMSVTLAPEAAPPDDDDTDDEPEEDEETEPEPDDDDDAALPPPAANDTARPAPDPVDRSDSLVDYSDLSNDQS